MRKLLPAFLLLALTLAAQAPPQEEAEALREQARALLRQAATVALEAEPRDRTKLLSDIASLRWKLGDRDPANENFQHAEEALRIAQGEKDPGVSIVDRSAVASARARAGDLEGATEAASRIEDRQARDLALRTLAGAYLRAGNTPEAIRTARLQENPEAADRLLVMMVEHKVYRGDLAAARQLAEAVSSPDKKAVALAAVAAGEARNEPDQAQLSMREAVDLAKSLLPDDNPADSRSYLTGCWSEEPEARGDYMLEQIAQKQAAVGDFSGAFETLSRIQSPGRRENLLVALASYQAHRRDFQGARATAALIKRSSCRALALELIAMAELRAADLSGAAATIESIDDPFGKSRALIRLAEAQINTGNPALALATLETARRSVSGAELSGSNLDLQLRVDTLARIALLQAQAGARTEAAGTFAEAIKAAREGSGTGGSVGLHAVARRQAQAGFIAEAMATANLHDLPARCAILRDGMSAAGQGDYASDAAAAAGGLSAPLEKAHALLGLAEGLLARAASLHDSQARKAAVD